LISIVTPSYNQAPFLEQTILSVLDQSYPNIEYIIIDGGSTDGSVEIVRKYAQRLGYWVSESDEGQADALRKGLERASGEIVAYLNSDDAYLPHAIASVAAAFQRDPNLALVHGDLLLVDSDGKVIGQRRGREGDFLKFFLDLANPIQQPSAFLKRSAFDEVGGIDPSFHLLMDYDLWVRVGLRGMKIRHIPEALSLFRVHCESKTALNTVAFAQERWKLVDKCLADPSLRPYLDPYRKRLYAVAHLYLANAHWLDGERRLAHSHYGDAIRGAPSLIFSRQGLSLLLRFALGRRTLRPRLVERR
jgi:glycosyltransferase involved in cell wall biosynthesis